MVKAIRQKYVRDKLNDGQVEVLELVYKYRFVSRQLIAGSLGMKSGSGIYEKLEILVKHDYLGKRLEKKLTLENVPAVYYLTPKALKYLQDSSSDVHIDEQSLQESYRDKSLTSNRFITHQLNIYKQSQALQKQYPTLKIFTTRDMRRYSYFPKRLPDSFLSLPSNDPKQPYRFFFDIVRDRQPRSDLINKLKTYLEFFDDGGWDKTGSEIPTILLLCEWSPSEKSTQRSARVLLNRYDSDLKVLTSTFSALKTDHANVWSDISEPEEIRSLREDTTQ